MFVDPQGSSPRTPHPCSYQRSLFLIIAPAWLFDSVDLGALTHLLAPISSEFGLAKLQAGPVGSATFAGMFVGAFSRLHAALEKQRMGYMPAVSCSTAVPTAAGRFQVGEMADRLPRAAWQPVSAGAGPMGSASTVGR
ncbi:hypothetical protein GCM10027570_41820 [Streptomonospora sediminis]